MDRWERNLIDAAERCRELRPKNHGVGRITAWVPLLEACRVSPTLAALYLQNQPTLDDGALGRLGDVLVANHRITGVNLGELPAVSAEGWRRFAAVLPDTAITDCYAQEGGGGPDPDTIWEMKAAIRSNRIRHHRGNTHPSMWRTTDYRLRRR